MESKKIEDIQYYDLIEGKLVFLTKNRNALFLNNVLINEGVDPGEVYYTSGKVMYSKEQSIYLNKEVLIEKSLLIQNNQSNCQGILVMGDYDIVNYDVIGNYEYFKFNSKDLIQISRLSNVSKILLLEENVFLASKSSIQNYSIVTSDLLYWSFDLKELLSHKRFLSRPENLEILNLVGVIDGILIVQLTNATLLFLDVLNGGVKQVLHLNTLSALPKGIFYDDSFPPHVVGDQLIWLNNQRLLKVDTNSFEVTLVKDYFNEPKEEQYRFMSSTYFDGKIFFVADYGWQYVTPTIIGVMDAKTGEILWTHQLEKTGGLPEPPKVTADKLYIRTAKGDLYIFDKSNLFLKKELD